MNENGLSTIRADELEEVIRLVLDGLGSNNSKRSYRRSLTDFLTWYAARGKPGLTKRIIQEYRSTLQDSGRANATINLRMCAIRKLVQEAADNGMIDPVSAAGVMRIESLSQHGARSGFWMTREEAQALLNTPNPRTLKGLRDRAILAVMVGGGLRRSEIAALTVDHLQTREGRPVICDLVGKGNRVRTVPIPAWTLEAIGEWMRAANIQDGFIFRSLDRALVKAGKSDHLTTEAIYLIVSDYGRKIGLNLACHDMRRSFAKLAYKGGAPLDQIQQSLGHASLTTTERYLGLKQDFDNAPCDHLGLTL